LVLSDDVGAAEAVASVPVPERATRLLAAGGDVVLTADASLTGELVDAIEAWAAQDEEQARRVRESAGRELALKEELGLLGGWGGGIGGIKRRVSTGGAAISGGAGMTARRRRHRGRLRCRARSGG